MKRNARLNRFRVIFFLLLVFSLSVLSAQDNWPEPVSIGEFSFDVLDFSVIGWSEEGRLAYGVTVPASGGGFRWQWFVQDLIEDTILYASPEWTLMSGQSPGDLWKKHPEWHSQLIRFHIDKADSAARGEKIFQIDGVSYRLETLMDRSESNDNPEGLTRRIRVNLYRNHITVKAIYDYEPDPESEVVDDVILKGFLLSPYEKRLAVVALEKSGADKDSLTWKYRVFGAHRNLGFSAVETGGSRLAEAVLNGQYYVARMFLENGADPEEPDSRGYPALLGASRRGLWDIVRLLLEAGANPDVADDLGRTPLHYAVADNAEQAVKALVRSGADPRRKDSSGLTPSQEAAVQGLEHLAEYLR